MSYINLQMHVTVFNSRAYDECFFIFLVLFLRKPEFVCRSVYCFCLDWNLVSFSRAKNENECRTTVQMQAPIIRYCSDANFSQ